MNRPNLVEKLRHELIMVWLERFALAVLAVVFWNWVLNNGLQIDIHYRMALACVLLGVSYAVGHFIYLEQQKSKAAPAALVPSPNAASSEPVVISTEPSNKPASKPTVGPPKPKADARPALEFPGFREEIKNVSLSIGGLRAVIPIAGLRDGTFRGKAFSFGGQEISPYLDGNHLYVDIAVYRGPNLPAVELKKGAFTVDIPGWDRNSDRKALEVVNERQIPVFQIVYDTPSDISIRGILVFRSGLVIAANETTTVTKPIDPYAFAPKRLFKYPSSSNPGIRED